MPTSQLVRLNLPSVTTTQRDALPNTADGQFVYNSTTATIQARQGGAWKDVPLDVVDLASLSDAAATLDADDKIVAIEDGNTVLATQAQLHRLLQFTTLTAGFDTGSSAQDITITGGDALLGSLILKGSTHGLPGPVRMANLMTSTDPTTAPGATISAFSASLNTDVLEYAGTVASAANVAYRTRVSSTSTTRRDGRQCVGAHHRRRHCLCGTGRDLRTTDCRCRHRRPLCLLRTGRAVRTDRCDHPSCRRASDAGHHRRQHRLGREPQHGSREHPCRGDRRSVQNDPLACRTQLRPDNDVRALTLDGALVRAAGQVYGANDIHELVGWTHAWDVERAPTYQSGARIDHVPDQTGTKPLVRDNGFFGPAYGGPILPGPLDIPSSARFNGRHAMRTDLIEGSLYSMVTTSTQPYADTSTLLNPPVGYPHPFWLAILGRTTSSGTLSDATLGGEGTFPSVFKSFTGTFWGTTTGLRASEPWPSTGIPQSANETVLVFLQANTASSFMEINTRNGAGVLTTQRATTPLWNPNGKEFFIGWHAESYISFYGIKTGVATDAELSRVRAWAAQFMPAAATVGVEP